MSDVGPSNNPYEAPRYAGPSNNPGEVRRLASNRMDEFGVDVDVDIDDEQRLLTATFVIDRRLLYRVVQFKVEHREWFRRTIFLASLITMGALTFLLVLRQPYPWALTMVLVFVLLHALQIIVPHFWARAAMRQYERSGKWPLTFGENRVHISLDSLNVDAGDTSHSWPLVRIADAFYLFDTLLICPEPGIVLPIPRSADFGADSFNSFCRTFALRLRGLRDNP